MLDEQKRIISDTVNIGRDNKQNIKLKINRNLVFFFVFVIGILIIGVAIYAYFYYFKQDKNIKNVSNIIEKEIAPIPPENILNVALNNTFGAKSLSYEGKIEADLNSSSYTKKRILKFDGTVNFDGEYRSNSNFVFDIQEPNNPPQWRFTAEVKKLNNKKYFKFSSIKYGYYQYSDNKEKPRFYDVSAYFFQNSQSNIVSTFGYNGWINYDLNRDFKSLKSDIEKSKDEKIKERYRNINSIDDWNAMKRESANKTKDLLIKYNPIILSNEFDLQTINDVQAYHYHFSIDKSKLKLLHDNLTNDGVDRDLETHLYNGFLWELLGRPFGWSTIEFYMQYISGTSMGNDDLDKIKGEVWIDDKNLIIQKAIIDFPLKKDALASNEVNESGKLIIEANFKNCNQPISLIEIPQSSMSSEKLGKSEANFILLYSLNITGSATRNQDNKAYTDLSFNKEEILNLLNSDNFDDKTDTDNDGIVDIAENNFFGTNFDNSDTDKDGYNDKVELENGYNPNGSGKLEQ